MSHDSRGFRTNGGRVLSDDDLQALADEAERGYDVDRLVNRGGRPRIGSAPALVPAVPSVSAARATVVAAGAALVSVAGLPSFADAAAAADAGGLPAAEGGAFMIVAVTAPPSADEDSPTEPVAPIDSAAPPALLATLPASADAVSRAAATLVAALRSGSAGIVSGAGARARAASASGGGAGSSMPPASPMPSALTTPPGSAPLNEIGMPCEGAYPGGKATTRAEPFG